MAVTIPDSNCPNCDTKLKDSLFKPVLPIPEKQTRILNKYLGNNHSFYCSACGTDLLSGLREKFAAQLKSSAEYIQQHKNAMPLATIQNPINWDYDIIGIVTGQSTTGTGLFSEVTASVSDFFGSQSTAYNSKLAEGEIIAVSQVRTKALRIGANAILGVDIDYAEMGGGRGMVMVCVTGTAVRLKNLDIFDIDQVNKLNRLIEEARCLITNETAYNELSQGYQLN